MRASALAVLLCLICASASAADFVGPINAYRRANGLPAVRADGALTALARQQASAMARAGRIGHDIAGPFSSRVSGVARTRAAENVAAGRATFAATLRQWIESAGHRRNLLMRGATRVGVASASNPASPYRTFWALIITN